MMRTGRSGDRQSPLRVVRVTARETDWEPIRGLHQGQRPSAPHRWAGHMTAIGQPASALIKALALRGRPHMTLMVGPEHEPRPSPQFPETPLHP